MSSSIKSFAFQGVNGAFSELAGKLVQIRFLVKLLKKCLRA